MAPAVLDSKPDLSSSSSSPELTDSAYRNFVNPEWARLRIPFPTFRTIHPAMFGQMLVMHLFQHHNVLSQMCGNNFMVLKVAPPLVITEDQIDQYLNAIEAVIETVHSSASFWSDALHLAQRAVRV